MKKCRRVVALLAVLMLCFSLCGCAQLDHMRANHAVWQEDGSILWDGNVYRKVEGFSEKLGIMYMPMSVYVTEEDVPVLLSEMFGTNIDVSHDGMFLVQHHWDGIALYCREDKYEEMDSYLQNETVIDQYFYTYMSANYETEYYYLKEDHVELINRLILTEEPYELEDDFYMTLEDGEYVVSVEGCDEKHVFTEGYLFDIVSRTEGYYIVTEDHVYAVPSSCDAIFDMIFEPYLNSQVSPEFM